MRHLLALSLMGCKAEPFKEPPGDRDLIESICEEFLLLEGSVYTVSQVSDECAAALADSLGTEAGKFPGLEAGVLLSTKIQGRSRRGSHRVRSQIASGKLFEVITSRIGSVRECDSNRISYQTGELCWNRKYSDPYFVLLTLGHEAAHLELATWHVDCEREEAFAYGIEGCDEDRQGAWGYEWALYDHLAREHVELRGSDEIYRFAINE